jgi:hypothetical protein
MGEFDSIAASAPIHALDGQSHLRAKPAGEERRQHQHHQDDDKPDSTEAHGDVLELHTNSEEIVIESPDVTPAIGLDIAA